MTEPSTAFDITALRRAYADGVRSVRGETRRRLALIGDDPEHAWIHPVDEDWLESHLTWLETRDPDALPLYGIPFAMKDNIDLAGVPTTAGCPEAAYTPDASAPVVQALMAAGAVPLGKTNLDQFATGLVGTRSPYGETRNAFDPAFISGGSSSGSAVATARGQVVFALGTDTAGSGRVPAALNHLIGLKPTRGLLSTRGVVPACRTLDTVAVFAATAADAWAVLSVAAVYDAEDPFSRPDQPPSLGRARIPDHAFRFGVPGDTDLAFFGDDEAETLFRARVDELEALGGTRVEIDFQPFLAAARLLYEGPWVAERHLAVERLIEDRPGALLDVTRSIIAGGSRPTARDAFAAQYELQGLRRTSERVWEDVDVVITPTTGTLFTREQVARAPVQRNTDLGYYTNFMNLLDLAAVAVPSGFRRDGLPLGVTLFAPAFQDVQLLGLADRLHRALGGALGATGQALASTQPLIRPPDPHVIDVAVCGAHMAGLPLNGQLTGRGGVLSQRTSTAPAYRLYALPGGPPHRPGLIRDEARGSAIEVEVWSVPADRFGSFVDGIPAPLGIGRIQLADGTWVGGFLCECHAVTDAEEITGLGSWRRYAG